MYTSGVCLVMIYFMLNIHTHCYRASISKHKNTYIYLNKNQSFHKDAMRIKKDKKTVKLLKQHLILSDYYKVFRKVCTCNPTCNSGMGADG